MPRGASEPVRAPKKAIFRVAPDLLPPPLPEEAQGEFSENLWLDPQAARPKSGSRHNSEYLESYRS